MPWAFSFLRLLVCSLWSTVNTNSIMPWMWRSYGMIDHSSFVPPHFQQHPSLFKPPGNAIVLATWICWWERIMQYAKLYAPNLIWPSFLGVKKPATIYMITAKTNLLYFFFLLIHSYIHTIHTPSIAYIDTYKSYYRCLKAYRVIHRISFAVSSKTVHQINVHPRWIFGAK